MEKDNKILFASDFDGTLYFMKREEKISKSDITAINEFQSKGNLFGLCTGRSLKGVEPFLEEIIKPDFYILASGALILDGNKKPIYKKCISRGTLETIVTEYIDKYELVIQANDTVYNFHEAYPLQTKIDSIDDIGSENFYGISFGFFSEDEAVKLAQNLNAQMGEEIAAFPNKNSVDIVSKNASKGKALAFLKKYYNVLVSASAGDSFNDIPMFLSSDISFTFTDSSEKVKEKAQHVKNTLAEMLCFLGGSGERR